MQRILIVAAAVVVLAGAGGAAAYFFFFANSSTVVTAPTSGADGLPDAGAVTTPTTPAVGETPAVDVTQPTKTTERLVQISKGPVVAGAVAFTASTTHAGDTAVNFIERESGNVFQYFVTKSELTRTSNKTIPGIQEALWLPSGSLAYVRYLSGEGQNTINTYALPFGGANGYFLSQNIASMAVGPTTILTLASGANGSIGTVSKPDGSSAKKIFTTPLASLRVNFAGANQYLAFTKPSAALDGYAYLVNSTGNFERIAGPLHGLSALASPSGKWVLLSYTSGGLMKLSLYEVATHKTLPLPVATIADKCVWAKDDRALYCGVPKEPPANYAYPDDWYQGAVSFSDRIWKIDVNGRFAELTLDFEKEAKVTLDATGLTLDPKSTVLVFRNKNDASLWAYQL